MRFRQARKIKKAIASGRTYRRKTVCSMHKRYRRHLQDLIEQYLPIASRKIMDRLEARIMGVIYEGTT